MKQVCRAFAQGADDNFPACVAIGIPDAVAGLRAYLSQLAQEFDGLRPLFQVLALNSHSCVCRLLQRPTSLSGAAAQAGLAAGRADAAGALMEGMPAGLRRIAGQAAQLLTSHESPKHLHTVEKRLYCPQTFLSSDFQCRDDVLG